MRWAAAVKSEVQMGNYGQLRFAWLCSHSQFQCFCAGGRARVCFAEMRWYAVLRQHCSMRAAHTVQADILDGFRSSIGLPSLRGRGYAHAAEEDQVSLTKGWPCCLMGPRSGLQISCMCKLSGVREHLC